MTLPLPRIMINECGPEALDSVMQVMAQAFDDAYGEAWNHPQCLAMMGLPGVWLSVAHDADKAIGFALGRIVLDEAELLLIAIHPDSRGRGFGALLLDHMSQVAHARGASRLHLEVRQGNPAIGLYERHGFEVAGRRRDYYRGQQGERFDALTLNRDLRGG